MSRSIKLLEFNNKNLHEFANFPSYSCTYSFNNTSKIDAGILLCSVLIGSQGLTCLAVIKSRNIFVARSIARIRINQVLLFATIAATLQHIAFYRHFTV